jgi:DegV family protein with EDD domain
MRTPERDLSTPATRPVAVVTDSTPYLPAALIERWGIHQVSLYVGWGGQLRPEFDYEDLDAFYARLSASPQLPSTSQPSVGDFLACYEPLLAAGHDVFSLHIAGGLSGTCASAQDAARTALEQGSPGSVRVLDSQTGAGGLGCLVLLAAAEAAAGAGLEQVADAVESARLTLDIWFCLDTLEYLRRGGRIGAAQALVGGALKVKPILTFGTEIAPVGRVRTHRRAFERMVSYLQELHERGASDWIVQHAQSRADADALVEAGRSIFGFEPLFCTEVGPVLGAHLGAGMLVGGMTRPPAAARAQAGPAGASQP